MSNVSNRWSWLACSVVCCALLVGCGDKGPVRVPVSGTVKYSDGTIPTGEVRTIRFEPASMAAATVDPNTKAASGTIGPDGSFQLTTLEPNDGAFPGEYKVTFTIKEAYTAESPNVVAPEFASAATTPLTRSVKQGEKNHFDLTIEKMK